MELAKKLNIYNKQKTSSPVRQESVSIAQVEVFEQKSTRHPEIPTKVYENKQFFNTGLDQRYKSKDLVFFDLETTGLGSDANNYAFLAGFAFFEGESLLTRQLFLASPGDEKEFLQLCSRELSEKCIVSFNGKSFDVPYLRRRFQFYGLQWPRIEDHIDLYHLLKKIYPQKPSRLREAEQKILFFEREDDLPGSMAPQAYFEYLKFQRRDEILKVMRHNLLDIHTLASLLIEVSNAVQVSREYQPNWVKRVHKLSAPNENLNWQKEQILGYREPAIQDLWDLAEILRKEKKFKAAAGFYLKAYHRGLQKAIVPAIRALMKINNKQKTAQRLVEYALPRCEAAIQIKLLRLHKKK